MSPPARWSGVSTTLACIKLLKHACLFFDEQARGAMPAQKTKDSIWRPGIAWMGRLALASKASKEIIQGYRPLSL